MSRENERVAEVLLEEERHARLAIGRRTAATAPAAGGVQEQDRDEHEKRTGRRHPGRLPAEGVPGTSPAPGSGNNPIAPESAIPVTSPIQAAGTATTPTDIQALNARIHQESAFVELLTMEVGKAIVGQTYMIERLLIGLLSQGHILLEGVPGF